MGPKGAARRRIAPLAMCLGLAVGCEARLEPLTPHLPPPVPLETQLFQPSSCVLTTAAAAKLLPQSTAAMVVFDRPGELLAALTGTGGLGAPFDQLGKAVSAWAAGLDLGIASPGEIAAAGLASDRPFGLAWLEPDQDTVVLFVAVSDPQALEQRLEAGAKQRPKGKRKLTREKLGTGTLLRAGRHAARGTLLHEGHAFFVIAEQPGAEPDPVLATARAIAEVGDKSLAAHPAFAEVGKQVGFGKHAAAWVQPARWVELQAERLADQEVEPLAKRLAEQRERAAEKKGKGEKSAESKDARRRQERIDRDGQRLARLEERLTALRGLAASLGPVGIGLELSGGRWLAKGWMSSSSAKGPEILAGKLTPGRDVLHDRWQTALGVRLDPVLGREAAAFWLGAPAARRWERALQRGSQEGLAQVTDQLSGEVWLTAHREEPHQRVVRLAWKDPAQAKQALAAARPAAIPSGAFGGSPFEVDQQKPALWMRLSDDGLHLARDPVALVLGERAHRENPDREPPALLGAAAEGAALAWVPTAQWASLPHRSYGHRARKTVSRREPDKLELALLKRIDELTEGKARRKAAKQLERLRRARTATSDELREAVRDHQAAQEEGRRQLLEAAGTGMAWCRPAEGGVTIYAMSLEPSVPATSRVAAQLLADSAASETAAKLDELKDKYETLARAIRRTKAKLGRHVGSYDWRSADDVIRGTYGAVDDRIALAELRDAAEFGLIGLLSASPDGFDSDVLRGDPLSARGNLWGDSRGATFGAGGLGLSGIGEGGGGRGEAIGLGSLGTIGRGSTAGSGQGYGGGAGRLGRGGRATRSRPPRVRGGRATVTGRLPPEVVRRVVRQRFGAIRRCYETGLKETPTLAGSVQVRFVIRSDGSVSNLATSGDLSDASVVTCIGRAFSTLSFPQPQGGAVNVTYPIRLTPGD